METPQSYCDAVLRMPPDSVHIAYHDKEYGFPLHSDDELFGRLILEINQAGLSWTTILNKKENFRKAYANFNIEKVARYSEKDRARLLSDPGIIRNRLKVDAAISNARSILDLRERYGSFAGWLDTHHPLSREAWIKLFRQSFKFTGGEITSEFLMSTGYLPGAHQPSCRIYQEVLAHKPRWASQ